MISFDNQILLAIIAILAWLLVSGTRRCPPKHESHTVGRRQAKDIAQAISSGEPAIFHGGCCGCIWRHQNTTHDGIAFCRGCRYFGYSSNDKRPDKSITPYDLGLD